MDENHPLSPMSPYASAKCGADRLVYSYWATYGIPTVILRPFNNYGPRQHLEKAVPRFVTEVLPFFANGRIVPRIDRVMDFTELPAAKERMEAGAHVGKIVLRMPAVA